MKITSGQLRLAALVYVPAALVVIAAVLLHAGAGILFGTLSKDPVTLFDAPFYTGALSYLGIMITVAAATVALYSGFLIMTGGRRRAVSFLIAAGLFTLFLAMDDLFALHELAFPALLSTEPTVIILAYVAAFAVFAALFRHELLRRDRLLLLIAVGFAAFSNVLDLVHENVTPVWGEIILEDGAKLMAIAGWSAYLVRRSVFEVRDEEVPVSVSDTSDLRRTEQAANAPGTRRQPQFGSVKR
ncbi:MAG: hypothetical protein WD208_04135 [Dehalococcoidia bacterium]